MDDLVASFEQLRPQLLRVAYGTLGSLAEAEDAVQEAWLRLERTDRSEIEDLRAWLTTVVARLSPAERTAYLLHDVFAMPFEQIAGVVGHSPAAVRQLAVRARRHVETERPRFPASAEEHERIVVAFVEACGMGDLERLLEVLDPDVVFRSDGAATSPRRASRYRAPSAWRGRCSRWNASAREPARS